LTQIFCPDACPNVNALVRHIVLFSILVRPLFKAEQGRTGKYQGNPVLKAEILGPVSVSVFLST
jgi:hypothetical protein